MFCLLYIANLSHAFQRKYVDFTGIKPLVQTAKAMIEFLLVTPVAILLLFFLNSYEVDQYRKNSVVASNVELKQVTTHGVMLHLLKGEECENKVPQSDKTRSNWFVPPCICSRL